MKGKPATKIEPCRCSYCQPSITQQIRDLAILPITIIAAVLGSVWLANLWRKNKL